MQDCKDGEEATETLVNYSQRAGTIDSGKDYEFKILAFVALRCARQDFENFWIAANVDKVGGFDDIVLQTQKTSECIPSTFMMQLKHQKKASKIKREEFMPTTNKGDFCLSKYARGFSQLKTEVQSGTADDILKHSDPQKTIFVLFTNRNTYTKCDILERDENSAISFLNTIESNENIDKIEFSKVRDSSSFPNFDCCVNIRLLANQVHADKLDNLIIKEMTKLIEHFVLISNNIEKIAGKFAVYIRNWASGNFGGTFYLTKQLILQKVSGLLLCQYRYDFRKESFVFYDSEKYYIWNEIVNEKLITIVNDISSSDVVFKFLTKYIGSEVKQYYSKEAHWCDIFSDEEVTSFYQSCGSLKTQMLNTMGKHRSIKMLDIYKCLWLNGKLPLLVEVAGLQAYKDITKILQISQQKFKVIIVNKTTESLPNLHKNVSHFITLRDIGDQKIAEILDFPIKLQGRLSTLRDLIDENMFQCITAGDVIRILSDDFNVGSEFQQNPHLSNYFVNRSLSRVLFERDVVKQLKEETFVIEDPFHMNRYSNEENDNVIICSESDSLQQMENLKTPGKVIHRLKFYDNECLEWKETIGSIKKISQFQLIQENNIHQFINNKFWVRLEDVLKDEKKTHLLKQTNTTYIVDAAPGMGKTTLLDFIAHQAPPNVWILKIYLNEYVDYFEDIKHTRGKLKGPDHLQRLNELICKKSKYQNRQLAVKVFQKLLNEKKVVVLMDGFDEISISYKNEVTRIIKALQNEEYSMWITTRSVTKSYLEENVNTISLTLKPFNISDQNMFLIEYFTSAFGESVLNLEQRRGLIMEFVKQLLNAANINLHDNYNEFSGIPLQLRLLAEVYSDDCRTCLNLNIVTFKEKFDLVHLYKKFFEQKHNIFYGKYGKSMRDLHELFEDHQQLFALSVLFRKEDLVELNFRCLDDYYKDKQHKLQLLQREGIIVVHRTYRKYSPKYSVQFIHRTFAEYLAAKWLAMNIKRGSKKSRTARKLLDKRFNRNEPGGIYYYKFLFEVFDGIVAEGRDIHLAIINRQIVEAIQIVRSNPQIVEKVDECGRSFLHVAALYGVVHPSMFLINNMVLDNMVDIIKQIPPQYSVILKEDSLGYDPLQYALLNNTLAVANKICEKCKADLTIENFIPLSYKQFYYNECINFKYISLFKLLLCHFTLRDILLGNVYRNITIRSYCEEMCNYGRASQDFHHYFEEQGEHTVSELNKSVLYPANKHFPDLRFAVAFGTEKNVRRLVKKSKADINLQDLDKNTPLHYALIHGRLDIVHILLQNGADINKAGYCNNTPLHFAVGTGQIELVRKLLLKHPQLDKLNADNNSPLYLAILSGFSNIAELLLSTDANFNVGTDQQGNSCLHCACFKGDNDIVLALLSKNADINKRNFYNQTPLHKAIEKNNTTTVEKLLSHNANIEMTDRIGFLPLHYAAERGNNDIVEILLKAMKKAEKEKEGTRKPGFDETPTTTIKRIVASPMHLATMNGHIETVKLLWSYGESCNIVDVNGRCPLHYAVEGGHNDIASLLVSGGANINKQDIKGDTPIHLALKVGNLAAAKELLSNDINANLKNAFEESILHWAVVTGDKDIVRGVLSKNVDVNCPNNIGDTPLTFLISTSTTPSIDVIKMLLNKGARYDIFNKDGQSALHSAAYYGCIDVVNYLIDRNGNINFQNQFKQTPLHFSVSIADVMLTDQVLGRQKRVVVLLLKKGANCNVIDCHGNSVLHYVFKNLTANFAYKAIEGYNWQCLPNFCYDIVQLLVSKGADVNLRNQDGNTAADVANEAGLGKIAAFLESKS